MQIKTLSHQVTTISLPIKSEQKQHPPRIDCCLFWLYPAFRFPMLIVLVSGGVVGCMDSHSLHVHFFGHTVLDGFCVFYDTCCFHSTQFQRFWIYDLGKGLKAILKYSGFYISDKHLANLCAKYYEVCNHIPNCFLKTLQINEVQGVCLNTVGKRGAEQLNRNFVWALMHNLSASGMCIYMHAWHFCTKQRTSVRLKE